MNRVNIDIHNVDHMNVRILQRDEVAHNALMRLQAPIKTDIVELQKDMTNHQKYREKFITDADIWTSIYPDKASFEYSTFYEIEDEGIKVTHDSFQRISTSIYGNDSKTSLRLGCFSGTKNMTSIFGAAGQLSHNLNRRLKMSIGGVIGSMSSRNLSSQYNITNSTSVKCKVNRVYKEEDNPHHEFTLSVREQLSEEFSMELSFMRGLHDELKISMLNSHNPLEDKSDNMTIEVEAKAKKHITTGTLRIKNSISEHLGTSLELEACSAGFYPTLQLCSDISINMYIFQKMFRNFRSADMEIKNSRLKNINLLFGFSYGTDGFGVNLGIDLAGVTLKCPIIMPRILGETEEGEEVALNDYYFGGFVLAFFAGFTYQFIKMREKKKKLQQERKMNHK